MQKLSVHMIKFEILRENDFLKNGIPLQYFLIYFLAPFVKKTINISPYIHQFTAWQNCLNSEV
jgi:hypothetical protein